MSQEFVRLYEKLVPSFSNKEKVATFKKEFIKVIEYNMNHLSSDGLYERPPIDMRPLLNLCDISNDEIFLALKLTKAIYNVPVFGKEPNYTRFLLAIRYYTIKEDKQMLAMLLLYTSLKMYSNLYIKYWTFGTAMPQVMAYTVNNLSIKFDLKRLGSLQLVLNKVSENNHENYLTAIKSNDDTLIFSYVEGLRTRLNAFVKNIYSEFKNNYQQGNYLNVEKTSALNKEDNAEFEVERDTVSNKIAKASEGFGLYFINTNFSFTAMRLIKTFEEVVSENIIREMISYMKDDNSGRIEKFASSLFDLIVSDENNKTHDLDVICNSKFIIYALTVFNKTNTNDSRFVTIKETIKYFSGMAKKNFNDRSELRYRKAILIYIAYMIQQYRCNG
jgi:hypothetical protein